MKTLYGKPAYALAQAPDEPARSWMLRMACLSAVSPDVMHDHLCNLGQMQARFRNDLLEVPDTAAWSGSGTRPPLGTYCPLCLANDLRRGVLPYFRARHHDVFSTHCAVHGSPLFLWPHVQAGVRAFIPGWVLQLYEARRPLMPVGHQNKQVIQDLRLARACLRDLNDDSTAALAWRQQLEVERLLANGQAPSWLLGGGSRTQLKALIWDYSVLLASQFGQKRCEASHLSSFLGPNWLFATRFADGLTLPVRDCRGLAAFNNPSQRRSLLSLSFRMLLSFGVDPSFDGQLRPTDAGQTTLTRALDRLPIAAVQWAKGRSNRWPELTNLGFGGALRQNKKTWTTVVARGVA